MLEVGAVVLLERVFDGDESPGRVLGDVCRCGVGERRYYIRVLSVQDEFLRWHLVDTGLFGSTILFRLASNTPAENEESFDGELQELSISWRTVIAAGESDWGHLSTVDRLPKRKAERLPKDIIFCREMMVAAVSLRAASLP